MSYKEILKDDLYRIQICDIASERDVDVNYILHLENDVEYNSPYRMNQVTLADFYYDALILSCNVRENEERAYQINNDIHVVDAFKDLIYFTLKRIQWLTSDEAGEERDSWRKRMDNLVLFIKEKSFRIANYFLSNNTQSLDFSLKDVLDKLGEISDGRCYYRHYFLMRKEGISYGRCVAIAYPLSSKGSCYFSLSGDDLDYVDKSFPILGWTLDKDVKDAYSLVGKALRKLTGKRFVQCHLISDVFRYTDDEGYPLLYPVNLRNDCEDLKKKGIPLVQLSRRYSCCERKILGKMKFVNNDYRDATTTAVSNKLTNYVFKIRMKPCKKCTPALYGCANIIINDISYCDGFYKGCKEKKYSIKYDENSHRFVSKNINVK